MEGLTFERENGRSGDTGSNRGVEFAIRDGKGAMLGGTVEVVHNTLHRKIFRFSLGMRVIIEILESLGLRDERIGHFVYIREITKELDSIRQSSWRNDLNNRKNAFT